MINKVYTKRLCLFFYLIHIQKESKPKPGEKLEWDWIVVNNEMVNDYPEDEQLKSPKYESKFQYNRLLESALLALK